MEKIPNQGRPISPEEFFNEKIEVHNVSKEEFLDFIKLMRPEDSDENILQEKGENFDIEDQTYVFLRKDVFPEGYMPYLETHEKWEAYIARKEGYNLFQKAVREYQKYKGINLKNNEKAEEEFNNELGIYNYEFRHEYAIYKEYQHAMKDGKLDEYYKWFMDLREKEKLTANEKNLKLIENDTKIRESIYKKLTEGIKHSFTRN
ncbi:MAG: hypothetical protein WCO07_03175 [bacterium]